MKNIILIFVSSIISYSCSIHNPKSLEAKITVIERLKPETLGLDTGRFYSLHIELTNFTDSIIAFWTMSCSWEENWISEDNSIKFLIDCHKNIPMLVRIKPNQTISYDGIVELISRINFITPNDYRLGFLLLKEEEVNSMIEFNDLLCYKIKNCQAGFKFHDNRFSFGLTFHSNGLITCSFQI